MSVEIYSEECTHCNGSGKRRVFDDTAHRLPYWDCTPCDGTGIQVKVFSNSDLASFILEYSETIDLRAHAPDSDYD